MGRLPRGGVQGGFHNLAHFLDRKPPRALAVGRIFGQPRRPLLRKRFVHNRTVGREVFSRLAMALWDMPSVASRQMRERRTTP